MSDLTTAQRQRQNILDNPYALQTAEQHLGLGGLAYAGGPVFTKKHVTPCAVIGPTLGDRELN